MRKKYYILTTICQALLAFYLMQATGFTSAQDATEKFETESERLRSIYYLIKSMGKKIFRVKVLHPKKYRNVTKYLKIL